MVKEKIKVPGLELIHTMLERIHERMSQVGDAAGSMKSGVIIIKARYFLQKEIRWKGAINNVNAEESKTS